MKKNRIIFIAVLLAFFVVAILAVPFFVRSTVQKDIYKNADKIPQHEFGIVLGAGILSNGTPGTFLKQRLNDAVTLYEKGKIKKILLSGDNGQSSYDEISVMNNYLVSKGVPQQIIFGDYAGFDTYSTMYRAQHVFGIKSATVITQKFHLPRSVFLSKQNGMKTSGFSTSSRGNRKYFFREWLATVKSFFDISVNRKPKFHSGKVDTSKGSNIELKQL